MHIAMNPWKCKWKVISMIQLGTHISFNTHKDLYKLNASWISKDKHDLGYKWNGVSKRLEYLKWMK